MIVQIRRLHNRNGGSVTSVLACSFREQHQEIGVAPLVAVTKNKASISCYREIGLAGRCSTQKRELHREHGNSAVNARRCSSTAFLLRGVVRQMDRVTKPLGTRLSCRMTIAHQSPSLMRDYALGQM